MPCQAIPSHGQSEEEHLGVGQWPCPTIVVMDMGLSLMGAVFNTGLL